MIKGAGNIASAKELRNKYYVPLEQVRRDLSEMSQQYTKDNTDSILNALEGAKGLRNYSHIVNETGINSARAQSLGNNYKYQSEKIVS